MQMLKTSLLAFSRLRVNSRRSHRRLLHSNDGKIIHKVYPWQRAALGKNRDQGAGEVDLRNALRINDLYTFAKILYGSQIGKMDEHVIKFNDDQLADFILGLSEILNTAVLMKRCKEMFVQLSKLRPGNEKNDVSRYNVVKGILSFYFNTINNKPPYHSERPISYMIKGADEELKHIAQVENKSREVEKNVRNSILELVFKLPGSWHKCNSVIPSLEKLCAQEEWNFTDALKRSLYMLLLYEHSKNGDFEASLKYYYRVQNCSKDEDNTSSHVLGGLKSLMRASSRSRDCRVIERLNTFLTNKMHLFDAKASELYMDMCLVSGNFKSAVSHFHKQRNVLGKTTTSLMLSLLIEAHIKSGSEDLAWSALKFGLSTLKLEPNVTHMVPIARYKSIFDAKGKLPFVGMMNAMQISSDKIPDISFCFLKSLLYCTPPNYDYFCSMHDQLRPLLSKEILTELEPVYSYAKGAHFNRFTSAMRNTLTLRGRNAKMTL